MDALTNEDRRRIYEEEKVREEARDELKKRKKQKKNKQVGLGCLGIIAIFALVIGIGWLFSTLPSTTTTPTPVPEGLLLEFTTLMENETGSGSIDADILVKKGVTREEVLTLLKFIRDVAWPQGWLSIRVFDSRDAWEAHHRCVKAWEGWPMDEKGDPPECIESESRSGFPAYVGILSRNPSNDYEDIFLK